MNEMSTAYEQTGRTRQKARTRAALVDAARELLDEGVTPTVEQAADRASISRTTAYRYFANRRSLLIAAHPGLDRPSLLDPDAPLDVRARVGRVVDEITRSVVDREASHRAVLRLSLDPGPVDDEELFLRQGRALAWLEDALSPLRDRMPRDAIRRLAMAIRATIGIEAYVWLRDVGGLEPADAAELMRSSARTLLEAALAEA